MDGINVNFLILYCTQVRFLPSGEAGQSVHKTSLLLQLPVNLQLLQNKVVVIVCLEIQGIYRKQQIQHICLPAFLFKIPLN